MGITLEEDVYRVLNTNVDQLRRHTQAYLRSIDEIPIIYQIPISRSCQGITQPYGEDKILISNIEDLIIDIILEIRQLIPVIAQSKTFEDPKFRNLFDFIKNESEPFNLPDTQASGSGPPQTPDTNPPITFTPPPQPNFILGGNMETNQPWLTIDSLAIPGDPNALPKSL